MAGISSKALAFGNPKNKEKTFQGQRFDDELGLSWIQFKWRNHDAQIGRFVQIDPLSEKYVYNSTYAFSENKVTSHIELEGLEAIFLAGNSSIVNTIALESNNAIPKPAIENIAKTSVEVGAKTGASRFTPEQLQNFSRGRNIEAEQLVRHGLEKNNSPFEAIDTKTGKTEVSIPDAVKNGGKSTSEIKNVKNQSLTKQLRVQEKFSNDNGFKPELIINQGAKLSEPLKNSTFDIKYYNQPAPIIDKTRVSPGVEPFKQNPKDRPLHFDPDLMA